MDIHSCESLERRGVRFFETNHMTYGNREQIYVDSDVKEWIEGIKDLFADGFFEPGATQKISQHCQSFIDAGSVKDYMEILKILRKQNESKKRIFISHAGEDETFADNFKKLLNGVGIVERQIFKANHPNTGIKLSKDIIAALKKEFEGNIDFVCIISENYFKKPYCMNEVGGAWALGKRIFKIYVPEFDPKNEEGILQGMGLGLKIDDEERLNEFLSYLNNRYCGDMICEKVKMNKLIECFLSPSGNPNNNEEI